MTGKYKESLLAKWSASGHKGIHFLAFPLLETVPLLFVISGNWFCQIDHLLICSYLNHPCAPASTLPQLHGIPEQKSTDQQLLTISPLQQGLPHQKYRTPARFSHKVLCDLSQICIPGKTREATQPNHLLQAARASWAWGLQIQRYRTTHSVAAVTQPQKVIPGPSLCPRCSCTSHQPIPGSHEPLCPADEGSIVTDSLRTNISQHPEFHATDATWHYQRVRMKRESQDYKKLLRKGFCLKQPLFPKWWHTEGRRAWKAPSTRL